jgi:methionyl-tRNA formyltransferase
MSLRVVFMGSPAFAVPVLQALAAAGHEIVCVYSQPARPAGRGQALRPTPVQALAEARGYPVRTPKSLKKSESQAEFAALKADIAVVVAYGLILPKPVLEAPRLGCLNLHASLLPRWRGAAPIQRALMAGDRVTGVQVMRMDEGLDTGPVLLSKTIPIEPDDTAGALHDRLMGLGGALMVEAVRLVEAGEAQFIPQADDGATYAGKIEPAETRIDWTAPAREIDLKIRGLSPFPGAWFMLETPRGSERVRALDSRLGLGEGPPGALLDERLLVACGAGAVRLLTVQREGKAAMAALDFLRGAPLPAGVRLG